MQIQPLQHQVRASDLSLDKLASNPNVSEADKVREASRQFEAVLLRQILQESQKTGIKSKLSPNTAATDIYRDMINNELADGISKTGSFGLAHSLQSQLDHQLLGKKEAPSSPVTGRT